ncbi:hypothetical protein NQ317_002526 [Molorchus minor]|uniref:Uncharacterized protein n=1 Tax=Molorchus minor TaxID=1323400 RepID=A0ABQ9IV27_9CUCU|nr:hypothetical protein NQ317_002526 [Molorchus minor]
MAECKLLLLEWGFSDFITVFEEEGIDDDSFKLLDKETIDKLFIKSGPRLSFNKKYQDFMANSGNNCLVEDNDRLSQSDDISSEVASSVFSFEQSSSIEAEVQELFIINSDTGILTPETGPKPETQGIFNNVNSKRKSSDELKPSEKKHKLDSIFPQDLQALLDKSPEGKIVLLHKDKLSNDQRQKLVKIIVNELFSIIGPEIRASSFLRVSEEIESIFPNEKSFTYYIPYIPRANSSKGYGPRGKLWSRYSSMKAALRQANAFKMSKKTDCIKKK